MEQQQLLGASDCTVMNQEQFLWVSVKLQKKSRSHLGGMLEAECGREWRVLNYIAVIGCRKYKLVIVEISCK